ncbi:MAG TPA: hypothetical protein DIT57_03460 [Enterococcus sp.]|nr:hypothetical protein [Enterococcus sp.]
MNNKRQLDSKEAYFQLFLTINQPLLPFYLSSGAGIRYAHNGVGYGNDISELEGFSRVLWGAGPAASLLDEEWKQLILSGIRHGTDPAHPDYWGTIEAFDQRMVEVPALLFSLWLNNGAWWQQFTTKEQQQIIDWVMPLLEKECPDGNWQFFKVLVGTIVQKFGFKINEMDLAAAFTKIEACYLGAGWYQDSKRGRQDYYNPFAFHYYGLLYSVLEPEQSRSMVYQKRAKEFAEDYLHFYAEDGANLPFGRSLTYRFAVSSFWSAVVWSGIMPEAMGVIKGIINRNLRWWLDKDIFDGNGILTLGYTYSQLSLTEPYNSNLSPLWLNKLFLLLDLPADHAYFLAKEQAMPPRDNQKLITTANFQITHDNGHTVLHNGGQAGPNYHTLSNEKYLKFAYSSAFGFSIPRANQLKEELAMDSMIGIQRTDTTVWTSVARKDTAVIGQFLVRNQVTDLVSDEQFVASTWQPIKGNWLRTWLVPFNGWQIRLHQLHFTSEYAVYETGFALPNPRGKTGVVNEGDGESSMSSPSGFSGIVDLTPMSHKRTVCGINCLPNTNVMSWEMTFLPGIEKVYASGDHFLVTGVYAHPNESYGHQIWQEKPIINLLEDGYVSLQLGELRKEIRLRENRK